MRILTLVILYIMSSQAFSTVDYPCENTQEEQFRALEEVSHGVEKYLKEFTFLPLDAIDLVPNYLETIPELLIRDSIYLLPESEEIYTSCFGDAPEGEIWLQMCFYSLGGNDESCSQER